jgi:hypothetical protein
MITGVRVAERNDQVAGTKGSNVRTNGECVGTRYGEMRRDIYRRDIYRKRGETKESRASSKAEAREPDSGMDKRAERVPEPKLGNRTWGTGLNNYLARSSTHTVDDEALTAELRSAR